MEYHNKKRILITGGSGFIGSHLCETLLYKGNDVICVDNLFTGTKDNIKHLLNHYNFEFIRHDISFPLYIEVDEIYNLACPASPPWYQADPIQTIKTSFHGSMNMLGLARRCNAKILQASTSEVYGDPIIHPQQESYFGNVNSFGPRACYDEGKRISETLFYEYYKQYEVDIRIARIFNTYGPKMHQNDGRVISNFIVQALKGNDLTVYGEGNQTRSFQYIDDLVNGLICLMDADSNLEDIHSPFNLGNPEEYTILMLAEKIINKIKSSSEIIFMDLPKDDPTRRCPDITKAKSILNWSPKVSLDEGLEKTINFFK